EIAAAARPAPRAGGVTDAEVLTALQQLEAGAGAGEAVNGINNLKSITWLETAVRVSRSVCRVLVTSAKGSGYGSGFLIAPDRVMTNNHVIGSKKDARAARIEFNYRLALGGVGDPTVRYELDPAAFFHTSPEDELDYTVVAVRPTPGQPPPEAWGVLTLNADAVPVPRDLVPVIQHPNAQVQQVALTSSVVVRVKPPYLHYTTDTMPGSSGSPVFNDLWQVVAIHHAAGPVVGKVETNEGVLMSAIRPHLGAHWPAPPG
ncbi:MAG TPA: trypsin-like peptidase domain-containing protein, partial [Urbifossiella sp.]|nr:trypsin-like peptidase domain-containing protein [Urbifossiella sp.]